MLLCQEFRAAVLILASALALPAHSGFGFDDVARRAQDLAGKSYRAPESPLPSELRDLDYDAFRDIRFKTERSLWRGSNLPFEIQFFHLGLFYQHPVTINVLSAQGTRPFPFNPDHFSYGRNKVDPKKLKKLGYAGFRIHYPLNRPDYKDEVAVFLGASYFRAVGRGHGYGLSARGLALDTALPSGEEFPAFREFWIEWPRAGAKEIVVYALLDSRRATGAYRFVIRPGDATGMDVRARVFLREGVGKFALAPLSSMYFFGENHPAPVEDYRPEVHDSDGLLMAAANGDWLWRPLTNPKRLLVTSFQFTSPRGFGLLQRDRVFARYEDLEARYEKRPSAWIEPQGDWGAGRVELVQIPTADEFNDNIVAYWVPDAPPAPRAPYDFSYRLSWTSEGRMSPVAQVLQTRRGAANEKDATRFVIDFGGGPLDTLPPQATLELTTHVGQGGELLEQRADRNEAGGGWRVVLTVKRADADRPLELRAFLRGREGPVSEIWSYVWPAS